MTLGRLVEAVGAATVDLEEQVAVLRHVLESCDARRLERGVSTDLVNLVGSR